MSQLEIQILHQDYVLTCPDGKESQLMEAVQRVDEQYKTMRDTSKLRSRERVGVLLAVNLAYENLELRQQMQTLQQQIAQLQAHTALLEPAPHAQELHVLQQQAAYDAALAQRLVEQLDTVLAPAAQDTAERPEPFAPHVSLAAASLPALAEESALATPPEDAPLLPIAKGVELEQDAPEAL